MKNAICIRPSGCSEKIAVVVFIMIKNGPSEDFIEFLNGLCSWIYYDEDEAESDDDLGEESEGEEEEN